MNEPATLSPAEFHRQPGVSDWRVTSSGPQAVFTATSLTQADVRPFFTAALGYDDLWDSDAVDPLRREPQLAFNPITGDSNAPAWWTIASPDNHGIDIASWPDTYEEKSHTKDRSRRSVCSAETEGFEPSVPLRGLHLSRVVH